MIPRIRIFVAATLMLVAGFGPLRAEEWLRLQWEDLIPDAGPLTSPIVGMPKKQLEWFYAAEYWRTYYVRSTPTEKTLLDDRENARKDAEKAEQLLTAKGVDVEDLFKRYYAWQDEVQRRRGATKAEYDGKQVALPGYLLPLDFNEEGVSEFLLVPYVGACIHVPPPPPNQVVYVKTAKPHKLDQLFDGVMATGTMKVAPVTKNLSLADGSDNVDAGYTLEADSIEPYEAEASGTPN